MTCDPLAYTGAGPLGLLIALAIVCVVAGAVLLLMFRRRGRAVNIVLMLIVSGAAVSLAVGTPSQAMADDCPPAENSPTEVIQANNSLTIIQTSVMEGLVPGIEPVAITGTVTNNGTDSTDIAAIDVEIAGIITDPDAAPGSCDPGDYVLLNPRMLVGRTLSPGGSTEFAGASIGFNNKSTNQDTCKSAIVRLLYTANPN
jgi:hypothetical protein